MTLAHALDRQLRCIFEFFFLVLLVMNNASSCFDTTIKSHARIMDACSRVDDLLIIVKQGQDRGFVPWHRREPTALLAILD
jgi:hypothetical protein